MTETPAQELARLREENAVLREELAHIRDISLAFVLPGAEAVKLTPLQRRILYFLHARQGAIVTNEYLMQSLYYLRTDGEVPGDEVLRVCAYWIRKGLKGTSWTLETVWGVGLKLVHRAQVAA